MSVAAKRAVASSSDTRITKETKWAKMVAAEIHSHLQNISPKYAADVAQKLCYANEVRQYTNDVAECNKWEHRNNRLCNGISCIFFGTIDYQTQGTNNTIRF